MVNVTLQSCLWLCGVTFVEFGTANCAPNHSPIRPFSPSTRKWYFQSAIVTKYMHFCSSFKLPIHAHPFHLPCTALLMRGEKYKTWNFSCHFPTFLLFHQSLIIPWAPPQAQQRFYYRVHKWDDCSQKPQEKRNRDLPHPQPQSKQNTSTMSSVGDFFLRFSHSFILFFPSCRVECKYR